MAIIKQILMFENISRLKLGGVKNVLQERTRQLQKRIRRCNIQNAGLWNKNLA